MEQMAAHSGVKFNQVPFKGEPEALDVLDSDPARPTDLWNALLEDGVEAAS